jgi:fluoride ion exporter CrcB/FEX
MSLPVTANERKSEQIIWSAADSELLAGGESTPKNRNRASGIFRVGRSETPTSVASKGSIASENWVVIQENPTSNTDDDGSDEELAVNATSAAAEEGTQKALMDDVDYNEGSPSEPSTRSEDAKTFFQRQKMLYVLYLSAFSIFGSTIRVFLTRFFGLDCEISDSKLDEFCVTATGETIQRGGALFTDLPANVVGCFIMGLVTSLKPDVWPPLPWFRYDHPLQQHDAYHVGIRTGLCGSITTFSSWNAQMIVMMDGTGTQLGSQIVAALFGYVIGFFCAVSSFMVGTHVSTWLTRWKNPEIAHEDDEELRLNTVESIDHGEGSLRRRHVSTLGPTPPQRIIVFPQFLSSENQFCHRWRALFCSGRIPFVILVVLLATYAIGGLANDDTFYRTMFFTSIFTPPGALLRWELYKWNSRISSQRSRRMKWLPWGTFVANVLGSCVCILLLALQIRYFDDSVNNIWAISLLTALRAGFAGSLSTVSTMVKEMYELNSKFPYHAKAYHYATLTVVSSIVLGLCLYSPIVRSH